MAQIIYKTCILVLLYAVGHETILYVPTGCRKSGALRSWRSQLLNASISSEIGGAAGEQRVPQKSEELVLGHVSEPSGAVFWLRSEPSILARALMVAAAAAATATGSSAAPIPTLFRAQDVWELRIWRRQPGQSDQDEPALPRLAISMF